MPVKSLHCPHQVEPQLVDFDRAEATITGSPLKVSGVKEEPKHKHVKEGEPESSCVMTDCRSVQEVTTNTSFYKWNKKL